MGCLEEDVVHRFVEGALPRAEISLVDAHIDACARCRARVAAAGATGSSGPRGAATPVVRSVTREITCASGDLLGGRYRILRRLGSGGMGDVYAAMDSQLHVEVAVKMLRPWLVAEESLVKGLRREVSLGRRVIHPSVCRVFDLHVHRTEGDDATDTVFLTMEIVSGETLGARIRREGPLPQEESLRIAEQMASALDAVHDAGIVHRDFKSDNIMMVPLEDGTSRAVLMDFGLARMATYSLGAQTSLVGTPMYMAPEQLLGGAVTPSSDVYALGVVLHEMLSGALPVRPFTLRRLAASIGDPRCRAVIERCLADRPSDRFARAGEVAHALRGTTAIASPHARARRRRLLSALVAIAAVLAVATVALLLVRGRPRGAATIRRPSVAVLGVTHAAAARDESSGAALVLAELLEAHLALGESVRVVPPQVVTEVARGVTAGEGAALATNDAIRLATATASSYVVSVALGPPAADGGRRASMVVYDGTRGAALLRLEDDQAADLAVVTGRFGARVRTLLGLDALRGGDDAVRAGIPADPEAARLYGVGLLSLRLFDGRAAREPLEHVVALAPGFAPGHAALAQALHFLREEKGARSEAERAFELSSSLSREERLRIEGYYRLRSSDWPRAIDVYRALSTYFPDEPDYALRLADVLTRGNRAAEALQLLDGLLVRPELQRNAMAQYGRASALERLGRWQETAAAADMAESLARGQELPLIAADADMLAAEALEHVGDTGGAARAEARARDTYAREHDRRGLQWVMSRELDRAANAQDLPEVERVGEQVLAVMRESGDAIQEARTLGTMAQAGLNGGDLRSARARYAQSLRIYEGLDEAEAAANTRNDLGITLRHLGEIDEARRSIAEGGAELRKLHAQAYLAQSLAELCAVDLSRGELASARLACDEGSAIAEEAGADEAREYVAEPMATLVFEAGDATRARQIVASLVERGGAGLAFARSMSAELALDDGDFEAAVAAAVEARDAFAADREMYFVARAETLAGVALGALHRGGDSSAALGRASAIADRSGDVLLATEVALARAQVLHASGQLAEAGRAAAACASAAKAHGLRLLELQARIEEASARRATGTLRALATDARAKGLMRLAARAERAAR